jgi:phage-related protein
MYWRTKTLTWLADSRSKVKSFPAGVQDDIGYALYAAQLGEHSPKAKPLHGLGSHVMRLRPVTRAEPMARSIRSPSEEVQGRDRDAEAGDRPDPATAQAIEN